MPGVGGSFPWGGMANPDKALIPSGMGGFYPLCKWLLLIQNEAPLSWGESTHPGWGDSLAPCLTAL